MGQRCVLRVRYNTSSADLGWFADKGSNGKIKQDPVGDFVGGGLEKTGNLRLNMDTAQYFRTFEDRTHVFEIAEKASGIPWYAEVFNFNARHTQHQFSAEHYTASHSYTALDAYCRVFVRCPHFSIAPHDRCAGAAATSPSPP